MTREDQIGLIAITKMPKIGPVNGKNLISYCGSIEGVFKEKKKNLLKIPGIGASLAGYVDPHAYLEEAEKEMKFIEKNQIRLLSYLDKAYPARLLNFESCPIILYFRGTADLNHYRTVAVVGTRSPTDYGRLMCERLVEGLAPYNVLLVSGLAFGIDGIAHRSCLEAGIPTLGVLGHGLDRYYPAEHKTMAKKMEENKGGVLSEFTSGSRPDRENFPMRNRIIASMSDAIIVVESRRKGGSIITADYGNEYNKDVFAIPGPVNHELSEGCNKLIKQNKAHLLESASDISYIMRWDEIDSQKVVQKQLFVELDEPETRLIAVLREHKELSIDNLTYKLGTSPSETASLLLGLEFKGLVRSLPGKKYMVV